MRGVGSQLLALAEKLESKSSMDELEKTSTIAKSKVQGWLAVLARCFQLQDALAILELDRVRDAAPAELDQHRLGLNAARSNRLEMIARTTDRLMARMDAAAGTANKKVLLHPIDSRAALGSIEYVSMSVVNFRKGLGIESGRESLEAKRWIDAVVEAKDQALQTGADGVEAAGRFGIDAMLRARSATDKIFIKLFEGALRRSECREPQDGQAETAIEQ